MDYDRSGLLIPACGGEGHRSPGVDAAVVAGCLVWDFGVGVAGYQVVAGDCGGKARKL